VDILVYEEMGRLKYEISMGTLCVNHRYPLSENCNVNQ